MFFVFVLCVLCLVFRDFTFEVERNRKKFLNEGFSIEPEYWEEYRDFVLNNTKVDNESGVIEIDFTNYNFSHDSLNDLKEKIFYQQEYIQPNLVRIKSNKGCVNLASMLFYEVSDEDYSFSAEDFRDALDLIRATGEFTMKEAFNSVDMTSVLRDLYIYTGIREVTVIGEFSKRTAVYNPFFDDFSYK